MTLSPIEQVRQDLLAGAAARMTPGVAREQQLGPWAHYTAPADSPLRRECAADFARAWATLLSRQARFAELLAAWSAAHIDVTVFKGFALAHLAYPHPALRHFNDIDVYLAPADAQRALAALPPGWRIRPMLRTGAAADAAAPCPALPAGLRYDSPDTPHSSIGLRSPDNALEIDLHRSLFKPNRLTRPHQAAATRLLLQDRITVDCGTFTMRSLAPADLALIGLAVNRGYGSDRWYPKAHDYLDLLYLRQQGLTAEAVAGRAAQLGLRRTWQAYARACDAWSGVLQFAAPDQPSWACIRNDLSVLPERRELPFNTMRVLRTPAALRDVLIVLPSLLAMIRLARRMPEPARLLEHPDLPLPSRRRDYFIGRGVGWGLRLLRPLLAAQALPHDMLRSILSYRLLLHHGMQPQWVRGSSQCGSAAPEDYAWLELNGIPVVWPGDARRRFYGERLRIVPQSAALPAGAGVAVQRRQVPG